MDNLKTDIESNGSKEFTPFLDQTKFHLDSDWENYIKLNNAIRFGHKEMVKLLIQRGVPVKKEPSLVLSTTPLHLAVNLGCPEIVKILLERGASINIKNTNHETPLIAAAKIGRHQITDLLLSVEEQKYCSNKENLSHLHIACMRNRVNVVKKLIQHGGKVNHAVKLKSLYWPGYTPLHFAVHFQCIETVQFLVNCGADITAQEAKKLTPLHFADMFRNEAIIDILLSVHKFEITNPYNLEGLSHFHIACTRNNSTVVEDFLKQGADVNAKVLEGALNWAGFRPINFAIEYECVEVVKLLLVYNANLTLNDIMRQPIQYAYKTANKKIIDLLLSKSSIKKMDKTDWTKQLTAFQLACVQQDNSKIENLFAFGDTFQRLSDLNLPIWTDCTPLHLAIKQKSVKLTELLLKHGADITIKDARGKTPLHLAFESKQMKIVDLILLAHSNSTKNPTDNDGLSHFHISCTRNKLAIIECFLQSGADINKPVDKDSVFWPGFTPLHFAAHFKLLPVVVLLLKQGARVESKNGIGLTALDIAIKGTDSSKCWRDEVENSFTIIHAMLFAALYQKSIDPSLCTLDDRGFSPLHVFCVENDTVSIDQFMREYPDSVNQAVTWRASDWCGYTPLHFAVHFSSKEATDLLVRRGADISRCNAEGNTPLHTVFGLRYHLREIENPELLYTQGNPIGDDGYSHLHVACAIGELHAAEHLLARGADPREATRFTGVYEYSGQTPLHLAVSNAGVNEALVLELLARGAEIDARDAELNTPLHCTRQNLELTASRILLSRGAELDARNMYGETPLLAACSESDLEPERLAYLLDSGADVNIESDDGESAFGAALEAGSAQLDRQSRCLAILMQHVKRLQVIGAPVSPLNAAHYAAQLPKCEERGWYGETRFVEQCTRELSAMAQAPLDGYTTLYDLLFKGLNDLALHCENTALRAFLEAPDFSHRYPVYGYLLRLQLKRGLERRPLLRDSEIALNALVSRHLPEPCAEKILQNLSNDDLRNIILSPFD